MKLIFVYNAKSDRLSKMIDFAHKIVSPSTYACDLCSLTHGNFGEREEWTNFRESSNVEMEFHHIEDFEESYHTSGKYPVIYELKENTPTVLLSASEISTFKDVTELIEALQKQTYVSK